jgi:hypothetical protein
MRQIISRSDLEKSIDAFNKFWDQSARSSTGESFAFFTKISHALRHPAQYARPGACIPDFDTSTKGPGAIIHNVQAHASAPTGAGFDAAAIVLHKQLKASFRSSQPHSNATGATVLDGVINCLLGDTV